MSQSHSFTSYWHVQQFLVAPLPSGQEWHGRARTKKKEQSLNTYYLPCQSSKPLYDGSLHLFHRRDPCSGLGNSTLERKTTSRKMCWRWCFNPRLYSSQPVLGQDLSSLHSPPSFWPYTCQAHPWLRAFWLAAPHAWDLLPPDLQPNTSSSLAGSLYQEGLLQGGLSQHPSSLCLLTALFSII